MVGGQTSSVGKTASQEETQSLWIDFRCSTDDDNVEGEETANRRRREGGKTADREHDEKLGLQKKHRRPNEFTKEVEAASENSVDCSIFCLISRFEVGR
ncbi:hypothetical protein L2E82_31918 [Cichorium intybus]|uniref:Uncharacterized protein n=1 Tax=Cichorium intybus TaxID=13427 RepID=A0ACB9BEY6_CICIN|nr:hypothetical protein L2E82_31918 [Cichorium intybus]